MSETRKIAAILAADMVGYSRLAGADEDRTLARLRALRGDLIDPAVTVHRGRVVKRMGDGLLIEFRSVVDAVRCAIEMQNGMIERNAGLPPDRRIVFRIGVHLGDVVEEVDGDLMGDGVNIAARLEGIAKPGAIYLSEDAYRQVRARLDVAVSNLGETHLKNINEPVRVYSLDVGKPAQAKPAPPLEAAAPEEKPSPRLALPDRPSIAVLPFSNMSGDPEQEYFADGMVEDIITALSRFKELFVIARNSSFVYKGKAVDIQQVARELGVRYVLEGSVRKAGARVRITGQLIDAATRAHIWADKFDGSLEDVFELQDGVTESVVGALAPNLHKAEFERARRKPPDNLDAYDYVLRALPHLFANTSDEARQAIPLLTEALRFDPDYAYAHALLSGVNAQIYRSAVGQERAETQKKAEEHARRALALDSDDSKVLTYAGWSLLIVAQDVARGRAALDKATKLNPNLAVALAYRGIALALTGEPQAALGDAAKLLRLSPIDPSGYLAWQAIAIARIALNEYAEAAIAAQNTIDINPHFPMAYAWAIVAECGRGDKTRANFRLRQLGEIVPGFTAEGLPGLFSIFPPAFRQKSLDLMRVQGLIAGRDG
jgi:adenylate cyclase